MENKRKLILIIAVVVLALSGAVYYGLNFKKLPAPSSNPPASLPSAKILDAKGYPSGTTILLYKEAPPLFPKEVILENKELDYSGMVTNADGRKQISVSYISDKKMGEIADLYGEGLPKIGWMIIEKTIYEKAALIRATKGDQSILMSIAPLRADKVKVTFQYESR